MKQLIYFLLALCCPLITFSQDITGFWKGTMFNDSTQQSLEYEIIIQKNKGKYSGISHTSYMVGGITYYGVKKINVRIARDGKIVMQDAKWLENNYPGEINRNVIQLNVLDLAKSGNESFMDGLFVTNRSKSYNALTGRMSIKKVNPLIAQSKLIKYTQNLSAEEPFTAGN